ncbi:MAG TPA: WecB/TagA/CpsF family glycosyltransferase [Magnetospirillum sp.]|nr:WecB/TagA/CpsF family glycosyltransferase [Magnetospirillum sp.]
MGLSFSRSPSSPDFTANNAHGCCRLCGATVDQRRVGREARQGWGQWLTRCGVCAGLYLHPDLTPAATAQFYANHYRRLFPYEASNTPGESLLRAQRCREVAWLRAQPLAPVPAPAGRVLEVGSGMGAFLGRLHALRPDLDLTAVEPDTSHRTLAADGAPIRFIDDVMDVEGRFDLIVMFHVLEHLADPLRALRHLRDRLAPQGRMVIEVPDGLTSWAEVHPAHVSIFTPGSLDRLLRRAGLEPQPSPHTATWPGTLRREVGAAVSDLSPSCATADEIATLDATLNAAHDRRPNPAKALVATMMRTLIGVDGLGALSRWKQSPALDDGLSNAGGRPFRLGTAVDPLTMDQVLGCAEEAMGMGRKMRIADINVSKLIDMGGSWDFRMAVLEADTVVTDGMGVVWGMRLMGVDIPERVSGIDLLGRIMALCADKGLRPFVVGAKPEVLERAVAALKERYPALQLAGWHHGYFSAQQEADLVRLINQSGAHCLVAALSSPMQDLFLARVHPQIDVPVAFGVGGSLDVIAGNLKRAPLWVQKAGMEWLYRLMQEPRRLGPRYVSTNARFAWMLLREVVARRLFA